GGGTGGPSTRGGDLRGCAPMDPRGRGGARCRPPAGGPLWAPRTLLCRVPRIPGAIRGDLGIPVSAADEVHRGRRGTGAAVLFVGTGSCVSGVSLARPVGGDPPDARTDRAGACSTGRRSAVSFQARVWIACRRAVRRGALTDAPRGAAPGSPDAPDIRGHREASCGSVDRGQRGPRAWRGLRVPVGCEERVGGGPQAACGGRPGIGRGTDGPGPAAGLRGVPATELPGRLPADHAEGTTRHAARVLRGVRGC